MKMGMLPAVLYGCELTHYTQGEIQEFRKLVLRAEGLNIKGANKEYAWHLLGAKADPEFIIRAAAIDRLVREIWERVKTKTHPCQEDVLTGAELCALAEAISDQRNKFKTGV